MSGWWAGGDTSEERTPVFGNPEAAGLLQTPARRGCSCGREVSRAERRRPPEVLPTAWLALNTLVELLDRLRLSGGPATHVCRVRRSQPARETSHGMTDYRNQHAPWGAWGLQRLLQGEATWEKGGSSRDEVWVPEAPWYLQMMPVLPTSDSMPLAPRPFTPSLWCHRQWSSHCVKQNGPLLKM